MELESPSIMALQTLQELARDHRDAAVLARVVCLAVRVDPAFLREARLQLVPGASADAEADLWFSNLVDSRSAAGFVLERNVREWLQRGLAQDARLLHQAWALRQRFHPYLAPEMRLEEEVGWLALVERDNSKVNEALLRAVRAMQQGEEQALGIARWALRAIPRLPEKALRTEAALALAFGTSIRLGYSPSLFLGTREARLSPELIQSVRGEVARTKTCRIGVALRENALELLESPDGAVQQVVLPDTSPRLLEIAWTAPEPGRRLVAATRLNVTVPLPPGVQGFTLHTATGDIYRVQEDLTEKRGDQPALARRPDPEDKQHRDGKAGGDSSLEEFIIGIRPRLLAAAIRLTLNQSEAEDLVSEASLRFLQTFQKNTDESSPRHREAWLIRSMAHHFFDIQRKKRIEHRESNDPALGMETVGQAEELRPFETISDEDFAMALRELSPKVRGIFELHAAGMKMTEIAKIQGIPIGTVSKRLHDARLKLQSILKRLKDPTL
jgi:RNA polymerase sigma factor (sigma-70 family)